MKKWSTRMRRSITLKENCLRLDYTLDNYGKEDLVFMYAFHPLFWVDTGSQLHWPDSLNVKPSYAFENFLKKQGDELIWSQMKNGYGKAFKSDQLLRDRKRFYKYFTCDPALSEVELTHANNKKLVLKWDNKFTPYVAVWCSEGNVNGHHHLGVEPTTARYDTLEQAVKHNEASRLKAGKSMSWFFEIVIGDN